MVKEIIINQRKPQEGIMGTNYYLHEKDDCPCCKRGYDPLHIGKSSWGWCFSLHVILKENINTLDDWRGRWSKDGVVIRDEYGDTITADQMNEIITNRSHPEPNTWTAIEYQRNQSAPGPNNLVRHVVDHRHCIGHGDGTWDYITGDFS